MKKEEIIYSNIQTKGDCICPPGYVNMFSISSGSEIDYFCCPESAPIHLGSCFCDNEDNNNFSSCSGAVGAC